MDAIVRQAITEKRLIQFTYQQLPRVAEPHVYGRKDGRVGLMTYQVGGQSKSGAIPNWRRVYFDEISDMQILSEHFAGSRVHELKSGRHSDWDETFMVVD